MSYQPYPEYKNCDASWLGSIPNHWEVKQLKRSVSSCTNGIWGDEPQKDGSDTIVLRVADFNRPRLSLKESGYTYRFIEEKDKHSRRLESGDLLIEKSGGGEKTLVGQVVIFDKDFEAVTSNFVAKMTPLGGHDSRYLNYVFSRFYASRINFCSIKQNTGIQNLDSDAYLSEKFGFPPIEEQTQIVSFLDRETAKIDTLTEKQQQLIKLLQKKRQAVIFNAVTKGTNPNARLKDSGVEWLGEVPEHWEVSRLNNLFSDSNTRATTDEELNYPVLSVSIHYGISDRELNDEDLDRKSQRSENRSLYKVIHPNYLSYNMMRAWQGGFGASKVDGLVSPAYVVCVPKTELNTYYFELTLRTSNAVTELKRYSRGITDFRLRLYWDEFKNIRVPIPPQREIDDILSTIAEINSIYQEIENKAKQLLMIAHMEPFEDRPIGATR